MRRMKRAWVMTCPQVIIDPAHYHEDGTCLHVRPMPYPAHKPTSVHFRDSYGSINIHDNWKVSDFEESHPFLSGPHYFPTNGLYPQNAYPFWIQMEILDMWALCGEEGARWVVEVKASCPAIVSEKEMASAISSCDPFCGGDREPADPEQREAILAECLMQYGTAAVISSESGNSLRPLVREGIRVAREAAKNITSYLSRPQNKIGTTGMELMQGNLLAPLFDERTSNPEGSLMRRMYGMEA